MLRHKRNKHNYNSSEYPLQNVLHVDNKSKRPIGLQLSKSTLGYKKKVLTLYKESPWLDIHVIQPKTQNSPTVPSLPSYVLGGGMLPVPENDVPYRVSQRPVEIC